MFTIGQDFGRATLLIDAVNDAEDDTKTGNFNAWQAAMDIPKDLESARCRVAGILDSLHERTTRLSDTAASYIKSAESFILPGLGESKPQQGGLASFLLPSALFAQSGPMSSSLREISESFTGPSGSADALFCQQHFDRTTSLTPLGWVCLLIMVVAGVYCAMRNSGKKD